MSKVIVITGAGVGLGRALARRFAREGETIVALGRTASKVEAVADELGGSAMGIGCDVSQPDSVRAAFAKIAERHAKIDVLINNAAIFQPFTVAAATDKQILDPILTNLAGGVFCARAAIPMMERGGYIINVSSESAGMVYPHLSLYQASKAGLERFGESLYHELAPQGIRVTNVRAGTMYEEGKAWDVDPAAAMAFAQATMAVGLNLREQPIAHFDSVTHIFRALLDTPPDLHAVTVNLHSRRP